MIKLSFGRISIGTTTDDKSETFSQTLLFQPQIVFELRPQGEGRYGWRYSAGGTPTPEISSPLGIQSRLYEISTGLVKYNPEAGERGIDNMVEGTKDIEPQTLLTLASGLLIKGPKRL